MSGGSQLPNASGRSLGRGSFAEQFCFPFLLRAQNPDGGWGYRLGSKSSVESTSWAVLALAGLSNSSGTRQAAERGSEWLHRSQLPNGSWPAYVGQPEGCWVTAVACLALDAQKKATDTVAKGTVWLCDAWPGEGGFWWRLRHRLVAGRNVVCQNHFFRGWSWTPGTSSWVEPTSYVLILLRTIRDRLRPPRAARRRGLGESMLYDRMCPGGGWNCGNPLVYGVAGEPHVGPTVWALLALQDYRDRPENQRSLDWLARAYEHILGPGSLALAHMCLQIYGRPTLLLEPALERLYLTNQFFNNIPVVAWAALALRPAPDWLRWATDESG